MTRKALLRAALTVPPFLLLSAVAPAQMLTFYANNITDATRQPVPSATAYITPTICPAPLSGFRMGGGGQATGQTVTAVVTNGALSLPLPDVHLAYPQDLGFHVVIINNAGGDTLLDYSCVQPSITASYASSWCSTALQGCDFDKYPPNIPTVAPSANSAPINNYYTSQQVIDIDSCTGADFGAKLANCAATYAGQQVTFGLSHPETCSTAATLGSAQSLSLYALLSFTGGCYITPTTKNTISCHGAGAIVNGGMNYHPLTHVDNPFFFAGPGASEVQHLRISGCRVEGYASSGSNFTNLYESAGPSTDVQIDHNDVHDASLFFQGGAGASSPSLNIDISNNDVNWDSGLTESVYPVNVYGAIQNSLITANRFTGTSGGVEIFASTSAGAIGSGNPGYAQILTSGAADVTVSNNTFQSLQGPNSSVFTSTAARIHVIGNFTDGTGDVAYDLESTVDSDVSANYAYNDPTACVGSFFTSVNNQFLNNVCVNAGLGILIKNAGAQTGTVTGTIVRGNTVKSTSGLGIGMYLESNERMLIDTNDFFDAVVAYGGSYVNSQEWRRNRWYFDVTLPSSGIGGANGAGVGLPLGNGNDGQPIIAEDNTIITTVAQPSTSPCIASGQSWSNSQPQVFIRRNTCQGPWSVDMVLNSGQTNPAYPVQYILRDNQLASGVINVTASGPVTPQVTKTGNYAGASATPIN